MLQKEFLEDKIFKTLLNNYNYFSSVRSDMFVAPGNPVK